MSSHASRWRGWASIFGGVLINLTTGTIYTFGNMTPYVVSYIRKHGRERDLTYQLVIMCTSLLFATDSLGIVVGTWMEKKYGVRKTILCGSLICWIGLASSFWLISVSFYLFLLTYGGFFGLSSGWIYIPTVISGMKWFPKRRGLVAGTLLGFCGVGGVALDFIQTLFINPNNLAPNDARTVGQREEIYFTQDAVLNRTPGSFLLQAGLCAILTITGLLLSCEPPDYNLDTEMQTLLDKKGNTTSSVGEGTGDSIKRKSSSDMEMKSLATKRKGHPTRNPPPLTSDENISGKGRHNGTPTCTLEEGVVAGERLESTSKSCDPLWSGLSLNVGQVIRRPYIWLFMAMQASCVFTGVAFLGSYKAFGIGFIRDDIALASIGSAGLILNALGHFFTGVIIDHVSIKVVSIILCGITSAMVLLVPATSLGGGVAPFLIVVCAVLFALGGAYAVQPVLTIRAYGEEHFAGNFILTTILGFFLPNILAILVTIILQDFSSWTTIFIFYGSVPGIAMFAGMFMNLKNQLGQDV